MLLGLSTSTDHVSRSDDDDEQSTRTQTTPDRNALLGTAAIFALGVGPAYLTRMVVPAALAIVLAALVGLAIGAVTRHRITPRWIGSLSWATIVATATVVVFDISDTGRHQVGLALGMTALAGAGVLAVRLWPHFRRGRSSIKNLLEQSSRIFLQPATALASFSVGVGMAVPLFGIYAPNATDPDSGWMTASMQEVRDNGFGLLQETHESYLPHLTLSQLINVGGHGAGMLFTIGMMVLLIGFTAYLAAHISGSGIAAFVAPAVLLATPGLINQTNFYPMYATAYLLGYGSAFILHRAMSGAKHGGWLAALSGVGFVLAYEAHSVVYLFVALPVFLLILHPWKRARVPFAISMVVMAVATIPRIIINFSIGGYEGFRTIYNNTWFIQQGYLREVNVNYHGQNAEQSPTSYFWNIRDMAEGAMGGLGMLLLVAVPVLVAVVYASRRTQLFGLAVVLMFFLALVVAGPGTYARYITPLAAGFAIVAGIGVARAVKEPGIARALGVATLAVLCVAAFDLTTTSVEQKVHAHNAAAESDSTDAVELIDDDRYVLGVRSEQLTRVDPHLRAISGRKMTEEDFVTFISWQDEDDVIEMMDRHDVGWVFVFASPGTEVEYHQTWLEPNHGLDVNHPLALADSDNFCLVEDINGARLYRRGECQAGDEGLVNDQGSEDFRLNPFRHVAGLPLVPVPEKYEEPDEATVSGDVFPAFR